MTGWTTLTARAVVLAMDNIDTDQLIPARFMSAPRAEGYGQYLLHDLRGPGFALDEAPGAQVLIAGRNFGSGSSREAAVYALVDAGFHCVVAPSFGDIFAANAVNNGLCPARVDDVSALSAAVASGADVTVDLSARRLTAGSARVAFALDPVAQRKLINGWDDIDLTLSQRGPIASFAEHRRTTAPWAWPGAGHTGRWERRSNQRGTPQQQGD